MNTNQHERSCVLIKPDGVQRGLIGEIITRFEKKGLKIVAMKMVWPSEEQAKSHYYWSDKEKEESGQRTIEAYKSAGLKVSKTAKEFAEETQRKLYRYLQTGPILAMVVEGAHAIAHIRKIRGHGNPLNADVGTITADLTIDSYVVADESDRAARNLVHASGNVEEAEREIKVWFDENEILNYDLAIEKLLYSMDWEEARKDLIDKD